ncbi:MAG: purine-nucleoside phosphorylase [Thermoproteales archaeon]|nr:purine-nucleoside phosphorylase [Thermoproteales archaeon]
MHKKPVHIQADKEYISPFVVTAGDPGRIKQLSSLLSNVVLVNENRGFLTYTGYWKNTRITVATHGIGGPSSAIVFEELKMLGAEVIVRLGTTGALIPSLNIGDIIIVLGAAYPRGHLEMYVPDGYIGAVPDFYVTKLLIETASKYGVNAKTGIVFSSDAFYTEDEKFVETWSSRNVISVEMECATLFALGLIRNFRTGAMLIVSNSLAKKVDYIDKEFLKERVELAGKIVFDALSMLDSQSNTQ